MKKYSLLFAVLALFTLILAACGDDGANEVEDAETEDVESNKDTDLAYDPGDIDPDTDVCEICGMAIADDQHATQIVLKNERVLKFDDLGDLYVWLDENGDDDVGAKFVRDFDSKEWIQLEDATFVYDEDIATPMGFGVISFENSEDAEQYIEENGLGELLSATDLDDHEWEMMDHDGDDDHSDHDADAFHTEGFDMHFTELEDVTVAEEMELEVNLTLDEEALEDARVRYEIWKENDKDNTNWVDAQESDAGNYVAEHVFEETGTYHIQIHVEDNEDLHEHVEYEVSVKE